MKNRILLILLVVMLALSVGLIGCGSERVPETTEYTLTIYGSSAQGGIVTSPGEGAFTYDEGDVVDLVATPNEYYHFINWTGDTSTVGSINQASTSISL